MLTFLRPIYSFFGGLILGILSNFLFNFLFFIALLNAYFPLEVCWFYCTKKMNNYIYFEKHLVGLSRFVFIFNVLRVLRFYLFGMRLSVDVIGFLRVLVYINIFK